MYFPKLLALLCVGITCGQQDIGTDSQMVLYSTNRDQHLPQDSQRLRKIMVGKSGPRGPPGKVDYTAINGTIKKYVKEISRRKLSKVRLAVEGNSEEIRTLAELSERNTEEIQELAGASDRTQRQVTQCSEDIKALKAEIKILRKNLKMSDLGLSTWYEATNGYYYKLFHNKVNYATAKRSCNIYGARLVSAGIRDDDVRRELMPLLRTVGYTTWVGLNDIEQEGTFYWEDDVRAIASSTPWDYTQPDNYEDREDCAEMGSYWNWKLNDAPCSSSREYLCEIAI